MAVHHRNTDDPTLPSWTRPEVVATAKDLDLVHDLIEGTRRMHQRSKLYIRQWADEDDKVYDIRRKSENVFEGLGRTLSAAVGMLFAKPPQITWNGGEAEIQKHWDNIDGAGTAGHVLAKRFAEAAVRDGLAVMLVDHPSPPIDPETGRPVVVHAGNEQALNLRPTWAMYGRAAVVNWRTAKIDNEIVLTMIVLHEPAEVEEGVYGTKAVDRYRVLRLTEGIATWSVYEKKESGAEKEQFELKEAGFYRNKTGQVAPRLPVSIAYAGRTDAPLTAAIPLLGVAWANLSHWRTATNMAFYEALCAFPQPTVEGEIASELGPGGNVVPGRVKVGPMTIVKVQAGGSFKWTELTGSSLERLEQSLKRKVDEMGQMGISFLTPEKRAAETAEARRLDAVAENSTLATAAQGIEDAMNMAHVYHAWYLGIDKDQAPELSLSRDFESTTMDAQTMAVYVAAIREAGLPVRLLLDAWQQGGRIPQEVDLDELELEMIANAEARRREREAEREAERERMDPAA